MKIALVKLSSIGDVIHTLPLAMQLKRRFPEARLEWIVQEEPAPLLSHHPAIDKVRIFPRHSGFRVVLGFLSDLFREGGYDLAVDAQGNMKSGLVTLATGAKTRLGFNAKDCRERLNRFATNQKIPLLGCGHVIDHNLTLGTHLGCDAAWCGFGLAFLEEETARVKNDLERWGVDLSRPTACFNIRPESDEREWCADRYAALADRLSGEAGYQVILNAGPAHTEDAGLVQSLTHEKGIVNLAGKNDIRELGVQYHLFANRKHAGRRNFFFGCDSAPLHLAHAVGLFVVGLYGSQNPERNGPYRGDSLVIDLIDELSCAPCRKRVCSVKDAKKECMIRIGVDHVWERIQATVGL